LGLREFLPYFREQAMDVAIIDTPWNGVWQSMKIANLAEAHEVNVAPHNFYGHLCTMMNATLRGGANCASEIDIDRLNGTTNCSPICPRSSTAILWSPTARLGHQATEVVVRIRRRLGGLLNYGQK
jgi:hypothetical protein